MTTEDKLKAYKDGFKDGFAEGYKQAKADDDPLTPYYSDPLAPHRKALKDYQPQNWTSCQVCGRTGVSAVVCTYPSCPSRAYCIADKPGM